MIETKEMSEGRNEECHGPQAPTRRDLFAMVALHALLSRGGHHDVTRSALLLADEMIEALERGTP